MTNLRLNQRAKLFPNGIKGHCCKCLELSIFRTTYYVEKKNYQHQYRNALTCTRCGHTRIFDKKGITADAFFRDGTIIKTLTNEDKFKRFIIRLKAFFKGSLHRERFDFRILRGR